MFSGPEAVWSIEDAVCATVIYADIFDFALTRREIERDLVFVAARRLETERALDSNLRSGRLVSRGEFFTLPNRDSLGKSRRHIDRRAAQIWPVARRFGAVLASVPFVRMVGVTGSLAADNPRGDADIDYLLVVRPNRLWLARAGAIAVVKWAGYLGTTLCPNYLLATTAMRLERADLYTAHELLQLVPLAGPSAYRQLLAENSWSSSFLPNRTRDARSPEDDPKVRRAIRSAGEVILAGPLGERLDRWEWRRKSHRLSVGEGHSQFSRDVCEGHFGHHRDAVLGAFGRRCEEFDIATERRAGVGR